MIYYHLDVILINPTTGKNADCVTFPSPFITILLLGYQALFDGSYELVSLFFVFRSQLIISSLYSTSERAAVYVCKLPQSYCIQPTLVEEVLSCKYSSVFECTKLYLQCFGPERPSSGKQNSLIHNKTSNVALKCDKRT